MSETIDPPKLTKKDFETDQDVRWCPGCGDYSILANVQRLMPELGIARENMVWVSGIGCSSRFPYYMNTYGFHTIHGRAPAFATGIKVANPDLHVWLVTGDGDGLSIGGNQLMHCLRRNVGVKILLFNNRIYGLTKGQYSPTSEMGKVTKSTPFGSADYPLDPCVFALGAGASFVGRTVDVQAKEFAVVLRRAADHGGGTFTEIYQNCNVFNDDAFLSFTDKSTKDERQIFVEHGKPLLFGAGKSKGLRIDARTLTLEVVTLGENGVTENDVLIHDETNATIATMLARMPSPQFPVAMGVLYAVPRPTYEGTLVVQENRAREKLGKGSLEKLLHSGETWSV
ncbi:MAG TPA: 2-oxoacid:ferredoxin oxidoreductase subunit beta [Polyangiaceae bacterium]|jgi:2-oxoglutarate ferredoxin oxidoreductase subunit beta|nr:2-oxoacid:ferredoxin oxidoreductase subunit beta [Polyangiaceae bacterium]